MFRIKSQALSSSLQAAGVQAPAIEQWLERTLSMAGVCDFYGYIYCLTKVALFMVALTRLSPRLIKTRWPPRSFSSYVIRHLQFKSPEHTKSNSLWLLSIAKDGHHVNCASLTYQPRGTLFNKPLQVFKEKKRPRSERHTALAEPSVWLGSSEVRRPGRGHRIENPKVNSQGRATSPITTWPTVSDSLSLKESFGLKWMRWKYQPHVTPAFLAKLFGIRHSARWDRESHDKEIRCWPHMGGPQSKFWENLKFPTWRPNLAEFLLLLNLAAEQEEEESVAMETATSQSIVTEQLTSFLTPLAVPDERRKHSFSLCHASSSLSGFSPRSQVLKLQRRFTPRG